MGLFNVRRGECPICKAELNVIVVCHRCYQSFKTLMEQDKETKCPECFQTLKLYKDPEEEKYFIGCPNCQKILTPIKVVEFMDDTS